MCIFISTSYFINNPVNRYPNDPRLFNFSILRVHFARTLGNREVDGRSALDDQPIVDCRREV